MGSGNLFIKIRMALGKEVSESFPNYEASSEANIGQAINSLAGV